MTHQKRVIEDKEHDVRHTRNKRWRIFVVFFLFLSLLTLLAVIFIKTSVEWQDPIVLVHEKENRINQRHAILVYIPGHAVNATAYNPLISQLQHELGGYNISLHAAIIRFPKLWGREFPPFVGRESLVDEALQQTRRAAQLEQISGVPVYLTGHSLGSILAQMVAFNHPAEYSGLLVHGGYVMTKYRRGQQSLPVPTLTLSGTRDGMNRFTYVAMQHRHMKDMLPPSQLSEHAPSILIEGMNHYQVANNAPPYMEGRDFEEGVSLQTAVEMLSKLSATFMLRQINVSVDDMESLEKDVKKSDERYFQPYIDAMEFDETGQTCMMAQQLHFDNATDIQIIAHQAHNKARFISAKPKGNQTQAQVEMFMSKAFTWFGRSSVPQAVLTLRCKMITKEQVFGEASRSYDSCSSINSYIHQRALASLPEDMQLAYSTTGTRLEFGNDIETVTGFKWLLKDLEFTQQDNGTILVESPRLKTAPGNGRYSGKLYCTLLSMSRALEHIMLDSSPKKATFASEELTQDEVM